MSRYICIFVIFFPLFVVLFLTPVGDNIFHFYDIVTACGWSDMRKEGVLGILLFLMEYCCYVVGEK